MALLQHGPGIGAAIGQPLGNAPRHAALVDHARRRGRRAQATTTLLLGARQHTTSPLDSNALVSSAAWGRIQCCSQQGDSSVLGDGGGVRLARDRAVRRRRGQSSSCSHDSSSSSNCRDLRCHATNGNGAGKGSNSSNGKPPPPPPPGPNGNGNGNGNNGNQADRLRNLMQNFSILGGVGGLGQGLAANVAAGQGNGNNGGAGQPRQQPAARPQQQQQQQQQQRQDNSGWASDSDGGWTGTPRRTVGNGSATARAAALGGGVRGAPPGQRVAGESAPPGRKLTASEATEWGGDWTEDWDPEDDLDPEAREKLAAQAEAEADQRLRGTGRGNTPRDKWITPLLDLRAVTGAVDPDQERTEDNIQGEALANKDESQVAIRYVVQLLVVPLVTGFVLSRALADPVLSFTLQNNSEAFAMTDRQKIEGAEKVHIEEARLRFDMAIGKLPPLTEEQILEHLREFAEEVQEEERLANEQNLITVVSDSISSIVIFSIISQQSRGRQALFNTLSRLFDGLSDIAKAVMIILIADTLLGYHSEEGWTGLIELIVGHYGFEAEEEGLVIFVGIVPVVIDVFFKYWIFIGLNRISPGAVITLKQIDTH